jgi:hypothetical protein
VITCAIVGRVMSMRIPLMTTYTVIFIAYRNPAFETHTVQRSNKIGPSVSFLILSRSRSKRSLCSVTKPTVSVPSAAHIDLCHHLRRAGYVRSALAPPGRTLTHADRDAASSAVILTDGALLILSVSALNANPCMPLVSSSKEHGFNVVLKATKLFASMRGFWCSLTATRYG